MVKIALIQPTKHTGKVDYAGSLGLSFISSDLKAHGHTVTYHDACYPNGILDAEIGQDTQFVGISVWDPDLDETRQVAEHLMRKLPGATFVLGGPQVTRDHERVFAVIPARYGIRGDGVGALRKLLNGEKNVPGLITRDASGKIDHNGVSVYNPKGW